MYQWCDCKQNKCKFPTTEKSHSVFKNENENEGVWFQTKSIQQIISSNRTSLFFEDLRESKQTHRDVLDDCSNFFSNTLLNESGVASNSGN